MSSLFLVHLLSRLVYPMSTLFKIQPIYFIHLVVCITYVFFLTTSIHHFLPKSVAIPVANTLVSSCIDYCNSLHKGCYDYAQDTRYLEFPFVVQSHAFYGFHHTLLSTSYTCIGSLCVSVLTISDVCSFSNVFDSSLSDGTCQLWNSLLLCIRTATSLCSFCYQLKTYLFASSLVLPVLLIAGFHMSTTLYVLCSFEYIKHSLCALFKFYR